MRSGTAVPPPQDFALNTRWLDLMLPLAARRTCSAECMCVCLYNMPAKGPCVSFYAIVAQSHIHPGDDDAERGVERENSQSHKVSCGLRAGTIKCII